MKERRHLLFIGKTLLSKAISHPLFQVFVNFARLQHDEDDDAQAHGNVDDAQAYDNVVDLTDETPAGKIK